MKIQLVVIIVSVALLADNCLSMGLLGGLYGNPLLGALGGCGLPCAPPLCPLTGGLGLAKLPMMNLGCPSLCCMSCKPCLLTKLLMLKQKLMEKKMKLKCGCGCMCGAPMCCGMGMGMC